MKNVTIIELSQSEISPNRMNKRPPEDECDDAALLPSVKKPHTDFSDLLSDKSSSTLDKSSTSKKAKLEVKVSSSKWFIYHRLVLHMYSYIINRYIQISCSS